MTLKIGLGLSFYNDFDSLRRMIASCQTYPIDLIIAIDGKYKDHPASKDLSDKQVRDLFKAFNTPYKIIDAPNLDQIEKRQIYFDQAQGLVDVIIVMDTDEYFIHEKTNWDRFLNNLSEQISNNAHTYRQAYCIRTYLRSKGIKKMPEDYSENLPRIFWQPWRLQYVEDHYSIRNKKTGVLMTFEGNPVIDGIALGHDHDLRSEKYNKQTEIYENKLIELENLTRDNRRQEFSDNLYKRNHS